MSNKEHDRPDTGPGCSCKVGRNMTKYDLDGLNEELLERRADGSSLRQLETMLNRAFLRATLREAETEVIGDVSSIYEKLTGDDVSAGERTETIERLAGAGVDTDALLSDFLSYQTVRTHLRDCLDVETSSSEPLSTEDAAGTIEWARARSEGIVERTLERLSGTDGFHAGEVDATHVIRVSCRDCGASYPVETFVDRGGCQCGPSTESEK